MKMMQRFLVSMSVLAVLFGALTAEAQQRGRGGFGFGGAGRSLLDLAADEAVQKDLGVSSDTAGKITSLRDDYRAAARKEYETAGIDFQDFQNLSQDERQKLQSKMADVSAKLNDEFTPKLKETLSADQFKRLKQIQVQAQGASALTNADVAAELKLSDDQEKKLADLQAEYGRKSRELFTGGGDAQDRFAKLRTLGQERDKQAVEILTPEQKEKFAALKGSEFDVSQLRAGGRGNRGGRRGKGNN
jgi:Spy/CpxP family protein refolding chaperone